MLCMLCIVTSKINKIIRIQTFFDLFLKFGEQPEIISNQKQKRARKYASSPVLFCARNKIRTCTPKPAPPPQGGVSTNFTIRA